MKEILAVLTMAAAILVVAVGCGTPMQSNPEFRDCANACTKRQDACMVSASSAADVARCSANLDGCVASCEKRFPRYITLR